MGENEQGGMLRTVVVIGLVALIASVIIAGVVVSKANMNKHVVATTSLVEKQANATSATGRNLILGTSKSVTGVGSNSVNDNFGYYALAGGKKVSDLYNQYSSSDYLTISFDWVASGSTISGTFYPHWNNTPWDRLAHYAAIQPSNTNRSGHYENTSRLDRDGYSIGTANGVTFRQDNLQGNITITNLKLETGNTATDWTPAPED